ncbi:enoyl-CoA hydratase/isomerase family protein [Brevibacillus humidisoli]|uniref:enoyl-CoA hydratase/isomerase family protein n=1 Tax=Brevibacillus humidisoli TaxID=2895522 RepID=UPI001E4A9345|nr:enoyl-CoA hydratase/isomerase family protein [Brevibacillus humidisoli]UFJ38910.1 enoyl-CoA hydratase/isomerase family protein [Brevibacillus humidisoli]
MAYQTITAEQSEGIGILTLQRPQRRNAINIKMRKEIAACLDQWRDAPAVGVVIITGAGSSFSAGFDLTEFEDSELFDELLASSSRYHRDVWYYPKPIIAAINGPAMGGGFDLAVLCDVRLACRSARFGHPEIAFGAPPLLTPLRWIVGEGRARELCFTGRSIDAKEAYRIGLVNQLTTDDDVLQQAVQMGKTMLKAPADTLMYAKASYTNQAGRGFEEAFYQEHDQAFQQILLPKAKRGFK